MPIHQSIDKVLATEDVFDLSIVICDRFCSEPSTNDLLPTTVAKEFWTTVTKERLKN
ncbi:Uu.00g109540.m01.CDS01 [Anthostomella pinea]|uniref:Uu.00g109540.m01.CDS01 n=1 Tax=Anthostomella pinea TaxID=933095 RepID=A0AAI8VF79_9PEZI|nr:Uu.00g109540.m01.CDS01 [Anthostomella pinea]